MFNFTSSMEFMICGRVALLQRRKKFWHCVVQLKSSLHMLLHYIFSSVCYVLNGYCGDMNVSKACQFEQNSHGCIFIGGRPGGRMCVGFMIQADKY